MQKNNIQEKITLHLKEAAISLFAKEQEGYAVSLVNDLRLELPKAMQHGDLVSNAAMRLAKPWAARPCR
jgi:arginyl-tRNA synthetase